MSRNLPPYIPPSKAEPKQQPKPLPPVISVPNSPHKHAAPGSQETVYVLRSAVELRKIKASRMTITIVHDKLRDAAPNIKIVPGMRLQITVLPGDPVSVKKGDSNAKA